MANKRISELDLSAGLASDDLLVVVDTGTGETQKASLSQALDYITDNLPTGDVTGAGDVGSLAFWTGASALSYNANLFWDDTNDWLGVGTSAPTASLSVAEKFQVDSSGNIVKINDVVQSWPTAQGAAGTVLTNDGSGNLSWDSASGGITGSGNSGYLALWNGTSTVTGTNNGTNEGIIWKLDPNGINALGVRGWAFFGPDIGNQIWLETPGSTNPGPPDNYVCDVKLSRNNTSFKQGIQFAQYDGGPNAITYNWFFGQVPDVGPQRSTGGKVVLYAGANSTAKPDGTQSFIAFRQEQYGPPFDPGEVVLNENQQNHDFRVAGGTNANALVVDASADAVGIGTATPASALDVVGVITASAGVVSPIQTNAQSASYVLALSDASKIVEVAVSSPSTATITVPLDSSVAFPIGTQIIVSQTGTGAVDIAGEVGVTIDYRSGLGLDLNGQWAAATLIKRAADTWMLFGDLV